MMKRAQPTAEPFFFAYRPNAHWSVGCRIPVALDLHPAFRYGGLVLGIAVALPLGLWLVPVLFFALFKRSVLVIRWRWMVSSLAFGLAISGGLGIFFAPLASFSGDTYGGDFGVAISRLPLEWGRFDGSISYYAAAWARVAGLIVIAVVVYSPSGSKRAVNALSLRDTVTRGIGAPS